MASHKKQIKTSVIHEWKPKLRIQNMKMNKLTQLIIYQFRIDIQFRYTIGKKIKVVFIKIFDASNHINPLNISKNNLFSNIALSGKSGS